MASSFIKRGQVRQAEQNPGLQEWKIYGLYKDTAIIFVLLQYLLAPKGQRLFSGNGYSVS